MSVAIVVAVLAVVVDVAESASCTLRFESTRNHQMNSSDVALSVPHPSRTNTTRNTEVANICYTRTKELSKLDREVCRWIGTTAPATTKAIKRRKWQP